MAQANIPLSVIIGILGAVQLATIASTEIPAYFAGGEHDGGLMLVNDGKGANYKETIVTPDGRVLKPQGRNVIMNEEKGTKIYTHDQWHEQNMKSLLAQGIHPAPKSLTRDEYNAGVNRVVSALNSSESGGFSFDEAGVNKWKAAQGRRVKVLNNRLFVKGR